MVDLWAGQQNLAIQMRLEFKKQRRIRGKELSFLTAC